MALKAYTKDQIVEAMRKIKNFDLSPNYDKELERNICPCLNKIPNVTIESLKETNDGKQQQTLPDLILNMADKELKKMVNSFKVEQVARYDRRY